MTTIETILKTKGASVITLSSDATVSEAVHLLNKHRIGAIVVSDDGNTLTGIFSERDFVREIAQSGSAALDLHLRSAMTRHVMTCAPQDIVHEIMSVMTRKRVRHLPVVERGRLVGIVSIGDIVSCRLQEMQPRQSQQKRELIFR